MNRTITLSDDIYHSLQQFSQELQMAPDALAQHWLRQTLDLQNFAELEWRNGPGGRRVGIKGSAIDVYTVVAYVQAGYTPQELAVELLPQLTARQIATALRYYAEYPQEIDQILAASEPDAAKERLERMVGRTGYGVICHSAPSSNLLHEERPDYDADA